MRAGLRRLLVLASIVSFLVITPALMADDGPEHQVRNMMFGVSGGNVNDITRRFCCSGTLGSLVTDESGNLYILSNNHILGRSGQAEEGEEISQPGLIDNDCEPADIVAHFTLAPPLNSRVDCAIAELVTGTMDESGSIQDIGPISSVIMTPSVGLAVQKSGRTTGKTTGSISSITTTVRVGYPKKCSANGGRPFIFRDQVVIDSETFSGGGDSGSLIVTNDESCPKPVALLFAGSSTDTIGNPIGDVLSSLSTELGSDVTFVGDSCATSAQHRAGDNTPTRAAIELATRAMRGREKNLMSRNGVLGVGIGASDKPTEAAIVIYVDRTGATPGLPRTIGGVKVRVIHTDPFIAY